MGIKNIIVHEVRKDGADKVSEVHPRKTENAIDSHAEDLGKQLSALFQRTGLNTGQFTVLEREDDPKPHFVSLLDRYYKNNSFGDNFVDFTIAASREFKKKLDASSSSKGGYLLFNHYEHNDLHFLSVVLMRKKFGLALSKDLTLDEIEQLDLDKLHMAARINLSAWGQGNSSRYIAFRIGRGAKEVTDYFAQFIGCEEYTKAKQDTKNLVKVTTRYCQENNFSDDKTNVVKKFVFDQCSAWLDDSQPVLISDLSTMLDKSFKPKEEGKFLSIAQDEPFNLSNELPVEKSSLKGLTRFMGRTKNLTVSFDSSLLNVSVFFDSEKEHLTITEMPEELVDELKKGKTEK